jgi:hypothetical protein
VPNVTIVFGLPFLLWFCLFLWVQQKGQAKDTGNIGHKSHKQIKPQQKGQSKDTGNIGHKSHKQIKPQQKGQSKDSGNIGHKTHKQTKPQQKAKKYEQPYQKK